MPGLLQLGWHACMTHGGPDCSVLDETKMVTMSTTVAQLVERTLEAMQSSLSASKHALLTCKWCCPMLAGGPALRAEAPEIGAPWHSGAANEPGAGEPVFIDLYIWCGLWEPVFIDL